MSTCALAAVKQALSDAGLLEGKLVTATELETCFVVLGFDAIEGEYLVSKFNKKAKDFEGVPYCTTASVVEAMKKLEEYTAICKG